MTNPEEKIELLESDMIEQTVVDIEKDYQGQKRFNYNYDVELVDQDTNPVALKFNVHNHNVYLTFEDTNIKTKEDLLRALGSGDVNVDCDCPDNRFRFSYHQTAKGYGLSKEHRRPEKTNPNNDKGPGCKHIACVLKARKRWVDEVNLPNKEKD